MQFIFDGKTCISALMEPSDKCCDRKDPSMTVLNDTTNKLAGLGLVCILLFHLLPFCPLKVHLILFRLLTF